MSIHVKSLVLLSFFIFLTPQNCKAADVADQNAFSHVTIYHSFNNAVAVHFEHILKKFNAISPKFQVIVKKSGPSIDDYDKVMTQSDLAQRPPLVWISGNRIPEMYHQRGSFVPLEKLIKVNRHNFVPVIYQYGASPKLSSKQSQQLVSLPFACSTPILFFNKTAFEEAGLDSKSPPSTWEELEGVITKLKKVGYTGLAITGGSMAMIENFSAVHDLPLIQPTNTSSFQNLLTIFQTKPYQDYLKRLARWHKEGLYVASETDDKIYDDFAEGNIAIVLADVQQQEILIEKIKAAQDEGEPFKLGVGPYPYAKSLVSKPFAMPVQGDTLWILAGHEDEQKGITLFLEYLLSPEIQVEWHQRTGYLPMTGTAYAHTKNIKFYDTHPVHRISCHQIIDRSVNSFQRSIRWYLTSNEQEVLIDVLDRILSGEDMQFVFRNLKNLKGASALDKNILN